MFLSPSMADVGVQELEAHHPSHYLTDPRISTAFFLFYSLFHNSTTARYGCVKGAFLGSHEEKDGLLFFAQSFVERNEALSMYIGRWECESS